MEFWERRVSILHSKQGPNPAARVCNTLESNALELTMPRKRKASSSRPAQHRGSQGKPCTQGSLSHYENKDEQQTPPSLQKGCGSAPGTGTEEKSNLSWDLTATEESHGESQSKFTQAPWPKISEKKIKCEVSPRTSMLANESCICFWAVGQNFRLLPLGLLVPHSSLKLPSPARGCCLPWIWLHVHWKGLDFFPSLLYPCPLASCWDLEFANPAGFFL